MSTQDQIERDATDEVIVVINGFAFDAREIEWIYANGPIRVFQKNGREIVMPALEYMTLKERLQAAKEANGAA
jgi:hypothetical protein